MFLRFFEEGFYVRIKSEDREFDFLRRLADMDLSELRVLALDSEKKMDLYAWKKSKGFREEDFDCAVGRYRVTGKQIILHVAAGVPTTNGMMWIEKEFSMKVTELDELLDARGHAYEYRCIVAGR